MFAPLHLTIYMHIWTTVNLQWQRKKKSVRKITLTILRDLFIDIKQQQQQKHNTQHQSIKKSSESTWM